MSVSSVSLDQHQLSKEELGHIFDAADIDGSGTIAYGEFLAATLDTQVFLREDRLRDAFAALDNDHTGQITRKNLKELLGDSFTSEMSDQMIGAVDVKKNGVIDFEEFLLLMRDNGRDGVAIGLDAGASDAGSKETGITEEDVAVVLAAEAD